jgi:tetratricopeptide (TPR) repeat protein
VELGRRLGRLRRGAEAVRAIASALELTPRDVRARKEYAGALASAWRPEDALAQRAIIVRLTPDDPHAWYELVLANIALGRIEEARKLLGEMADRPWPRSADDAKRLIQSAESRLPPR